MNAIPAARSIANCRRYSSGSLPFPKPASKPGPRRNCSRDSPPWAPAYAEQRCCAGSRSSLWPRAPADLLRPSAATLASLWRRRRATIESRGRRGKLGRGTASPWRAGTWRKSAATRRHRAWSSGQPRGPLDSGSRESASPEPRLKSHAPGGTRPPTWLPGGAARHRVRNHSRAWCSSRRVSGRSSARHRDSRTGVRRRARAAPSHFGQSYCRSLRNQTGRPSLRTTDETSLLVRKRASQTCFRRLTRFRIPALRQIRKTKRTLETKLDRTQVKSSMVPATTPSCCHT